MHVQGAMATLLEYSGDYVRRNEPRADLEVCLSVTRELFGLAAASGTINAEYVEGSFNTVSPRLRTASGWLAAGRSN
jgi:hypothetical protein